MTLVALEGFGWLNQWAANGEAWWLNRRPGWTATGIQVGLAFAGRDLEGRRVWSAPATTAATGGRLSVAAIHSVLIFGCAVMAGALSGPGQLWGLQTARGVVAYGTLDADHRLRVYRRNTVTGQQELLSTSPPLPWGVWQYLEVQCASPAAPLPAGIECRLNGRTVVRWNGNPAGLDDGTMTYTGIVLFGNDAVPYPAVPWNVQVTDFYLVDGAGAPPNPTSFLGPMRIETLWPVSDASGTGWSATPSGALANTVREGRRFDETETLLPPATAPDGDTSYMRATTPGAQALFTWPTQPATAGALGVQLRAVAIAEAPNTQLAFLHNATDVLWTRNVPTDAYTPLAQPWAFVPNTGASWRGDAINQRTFGLGLQAGGPVRVTECCLEVAYPYNPPHTRRSWVVQVNWAQVADYRRWAQPYCEVLTEYLERVEIERDLAWPQLQIDTCTVTALDPDWLVVPGRQASPLGELARYGVPARVWAWTPTGPALQFYGTIADYQIALDGPPWPVTLRLESPLRAVLQQQVDIGTFHQGDVLLSARFFGVNLVITGALATLCQAVGLAANLTVTASLIDSGPLSTRQRRFSRDWTGRGSFGALLADLLSMARLGAYCQPHIWDYDSSNTHPQDWQLVIVDPLGEPLRASWDWRAGDLHPTPQVDFGGEVPSG